MSDTASGTALSPASLELPRITVIVGHAGVGKTTLALNLALREARAGAHVTIADMDLVNPYFRTSDYRGILDRAGVEVIAPVFAGTTLDTPSLSGKLETAIERASSSEPRDARALEASARKARKLIIDVGGDDIGATGIGRYSTALAQAEAAVWYAVNAFRTLTLAPEDAAALLPGIEDNAHLKATGIVNTSNLIELTSVDDVMRGRAFARKVAQLTGLPLVASVVPRTLLPRVAERVAQTQVPGAAGARDAECEPLLPVDHLVTTPWDEENDSSLG